MASATGMGASGPVSAALSEHVLMLQPPKAMQLCSDPQIRLSVAGSSCSVAGQGSPCGGSSSDALTGPACDQAMFRPCSQDTCVLDLLVSSSCLALHVALTSALPLNFTDNNMHVWPGKHVRLNCVENVASAMTMLAPHVESNLVQHDMQTGMTLLVS
jgi:hypothetical protein